MTCTASNILTLPENDPRVLKCAANLMARFVTRLINTPRLPYTNERQVLESLQRDLKTSFAPVSKRSEDNPENLSLLVRLWHGAFGPAVFERYSSKWQQLGFQHERDPTSDFRGGGRLSLECLVYLVERHPSLARRMLQRQPRRALLRGPYANYPWACAAITVTKRLCELLLVSEPLTGKVTRQFEVTPTTFWHVCSSREAFFELFVWAFCTVDSLWDTINASYMDFGAVCTAAMQRMVDVLHRLPSDVVPSARSFAGGDGFVGTGGKEFGGALIDVSVVVCDEGVEEAKKEEPASKDWEQSLETRIEGVVGGGSGEAPSDLTEDLLGLTHYGVEPPSSNKTAFQLLDVDFFGEYGLTE